MNPTSNSCGPSRRILIVASFAESLIKFRGRLIARLIGAGVEVHVCAPDLSSNEWVVGHLTQLGCRWHDIRMKRNSISPFTDLRTIAELMMLIGRVRPTHLLAYTVKPVTYAGLAMRLMRVPRSVALITGLGAGYAKAVDLSAGISGRIARFLMRSALGGFDTVVFQNPDDRASFCAAGLTGPERTGLVAGSGVPLDEFTHQPLNGPGPCRFLFIGRLLRDKGLHEFVEAARLVLRECPRAAFDVVGWLDPGPAGVAQQQIEDWTREGQVRFHGKLDDVRTALKDCTIFVLPSYREGVPRSALEALAVGRALITTDAPGCRETVVHGANGFLVPVKDSLALAQAMLRFCAEPELANRMGRRSRELAELRFDVNQVNADMLRLLGIVEASAHRATSALAMEEA